MAKRTVVGTQVQRVLEDKDVPDAIMFGVSTAIFNDENIAENINDALLRSIGLKAEQMFRHAEKGNYLYGLPSGEIMSMVEAREAVEQRLFNIESSTVEIDYCRLAKPNLLHMTWMKLVSEYGYDPVTNKLTTTPELTRLPESFNDEIEIFLHDITIVVPQGQLDEIEPGTIGLWGTPPNARPTPERLGITPGGLSIRPGTPIRLANVSEEYVEVNYCYKRPFGESLGGDNWAEKGTIKHVLMNIVPEQFPVDYEKTYFQVGYSIGFMDKWWMYRAGAGTYPELDEIAMRPGETNGTYFPFIYFRFDKKSELEDKHSASYQSCKKLAKYLNLDYDGIAEAIDENPDAKDVAQAMIMMGVNPESDNESDIEYLYKYFELLYNTQDDKYKNTTPVGDYRQDVGFGYSDMTDGWNNFSTDIQDKRFRMRFKAKGIYKFAKVGTVAPVGKYTVERGTLKYPYRYQDHWDSGVMVGEMDVPYFTYRYQRTSKIYQEIQVVGLEMQYFIIGEHHVTTSEDNKNILLVPLDRSIVKDLSIPVKEKIYARSLHFVFNSIMVVKLKWYQTGLFSVIIAIIGTIISFFLLGTDGGSIAAAAWSMAGGSVILAVLIGSFLNFGIGMLVSQAISLVADAIGLEGSILVAVLAVIAAIYGMYQQGTIKVPWARYMIEGATNLVQSAMEHAIEDLQDAYKDFLEWADDATKELEAVRRTLTHNVHLSPFIFIGESPTDFYNRTVHSGNIGAIGLGAISSYVDNALQLPKIQDTLGDI